MNNRADIIIPFDCLCGRKAHELIPRNSVYGYSFTWRNRRITACFDCYNNYLVYEHMTPKQKVRYKFETQKALKNIEQIGRS